VEQEAQLINLLASGLAHCRAVVTDNGGLLGSLFVAGLIGSAGHCVGMCGPFVLAQSVSRLEARPAAEMRELHRLTGAALLPYHLGRMTTYAGLGAVAAALAGSVAEFAGMRWLSAALLVLAALFFLGYAVRSLGGTLWPERDDPSRTPTAQDWWSRTVGRRARPLFARPVGWRGYGLGVVLGFLPCGLLYGALAAAAAGGSALTGAVAMMAFTLGTVPALMAVAFAGHVAGQTWRTAVTRVTPVLFLLNAAALSYLAWRTVA